MVAVSLVLTVLATPLESGHGSILASNRCITPSLAAYVIPPELEPSSALLRLARKLPKCTAPLAGAATRCIIDRTPKNSRKTEATSGRPSLRVRLVRWSASFVSLPKNGVIDDVQLEDSGQVLRVTGWIASPQNSTAKTIDEVFISLGIAAEDAQLVQNARPDVIQAGRATDLYSGFTIKIRLAHAMQELTDPLSLCVTAASEGITVVRTSDSSKTRC